MMVGGGGGGYAPPRGSWCMWDCWCSGAVSACGTAGALVLWQRLLRMLCSMLLPTGCIWDSGARWTAGAVGACELLVHVQLLELRGSRCRGYWCSGSRGTAGALELWDMQLWDMQHAGPMGAGPASIPHLK